jgi:hypothetical protein
MDLKDLDDQMKVAIGNSYPNRQRGFKVGVSQWHHRGHQGAFGGPEALQELSGT